MKVVRINTQDPEAPARVNVVSNASAFIIKRRKQELLEIDRLRKEREDKFNEQSS